MGIDLSGMTITSKVGEIYDNGVGVQVNVSDKSAAPDEDAEFLRDLRKLREQLEKTEPLIANAVADYEQAVKDRDKSKIKRLLSGFASGTAKAVIVKLASDLVLSRMGLK